MSGDDVYNRWQPSGMNNRWVFLAADLGCRLFRRESLYRISDAVMDWYLGRHPEVLAAIESNLRGAFPGMERLRAEALALRTVFNYGHGVVDYLRGLADPPVVRPAPGADALLDKDFGAKVLLCAHMGNWEVGGFFIGRAVGPHTVVAFPERDPGVESFRASRRAAAGLTTLSAGQGLHNLFALRRVLERGEAVIALVDRAVGRDRVEVRFRGRRAGFLRSPATLATLADTWVLPAVVVAEGPGVYTALVGEPCRRPGESATAETVMQRAADFFGAVLERYPDQWYNFFPFWEEAS